jgi:hypothetical protein
VSQSCYVICPKCGNFVTRYKPLEDRLKQLDGQIPRLQAEIDFAKINTLSRDQILENARSLYEQWPTLPSEEKRKIAESLVQRITIGNGEIDIDLCYLLKRWQKGN